MHDVVGSTGQRWTIRKTRGWSSDWSTGSHGVDTPPIRSSCCSGWIRTIGTAGRRISSGSIVTPILSSSCKSQCLAAWYEIPGSNLFSTKPTDWLGRTSPKWPILCLVGRYISTHPEIEFHHSDNCVHWRSCSLCSAHRNFNIALS